MALHWSEHAKLDLLAEESAKPLPIRSANAMRLIRECSGQELSEFIEVSSETIEVLEESEAFYRNLDSIINPFERRIVGFG